MVAPIFGSPKRVGKHREKVIDDDWVPLAVLEYSDAVGAECRIVRHGAVSLVVANEHIQHLFVNVAVVDATRRREHTVGILNSELFDQYTPRQLEYSQLATFATFAPPDCRQQPVVPENPLLHVVGVGTSAEQHRALIQPQRTPPRLDALRLFALANGAVVGRELRIYILEYSDNKDRQKCQSATQQSLLALQPRSYLKLPAVLARLALVSACLNFGQDAACVLRGLIGPVVHLALLCWQIHRPVPKWLLR